MVPSTRITRLKIPHSGLVSCPGAIARALAVLASVFMILTMVAIWWAPQPFRHLHVDSGPEDPHGSRATLPFLLGVKFAGDGCSPSGAPRRFRPRAVRFSVRRLSSLPPRTPAVR